MGLLRTMMPHKVQLLAILAFGLALLFMENQIQRIEESREVLGEGNSIHSSGDQSTDTQTLTNKYARRHTHTDTRKHTHTHTHAYMHKHAGTHTKTNARMHTHKQTHTRAHKHTHTHKHRLVANPVSQELPSHLAGGSSKSNCR